MYEYRFLNTFSTKPSAIYNQSQDKIGSIRRYYSNPLVKGIDILALRGRVIIQYKIEDQKNNLVFESKKDPHPLKKTTFHIKYYKGDSEYYVLLKDKKALDIAEITTFAFNGETYTLEKPLMDWGKIKKDNNVIAEWKSSIKLPLKAYFNLVDSDFKEDKLFFLGIFHTYLHAG